MGCARGKRIINVRKPDGLPSTDRGNATEAQSSGSQTNGLQQSVIGQNKLRRGSAATHSNAHKMVYG